MYYLSRWLKWHHFSSSSPTSNLVFLPNNSGNSQQMRTGLCGWIQITPPLNKKNCLFCGWCWWKRLLPSCSLCFSPLCDYCAFLCPLRWKYLSKNRFFFVLHSIGSVLFQFITFLGFQYFSVLVKLTNEVYYNHLIMKYKETGNILKNAGKLIVRINHMI